MTSSLNAADRFRAHPPRSVLIVATQRLGDVLLATPLIRSVRAAWPQAAIHALVFDDTRSVLAANTDVDEILTVPRRPDRAGHWRLMRRLWRRYDLALSTGPGDRPTLYAWMAGRFRAGFSLPGRNHAWKRALLDVRVAFDDLETHTVDANLALADAVGIPRRCEVTLAWSPDDAQSVADALDASAHPYAVLHMSAKFAYKNWHAEGWHRLAAWLVERGLHVVFTGTDAPAERTTIDAVRARLPDEATSALTRLSLPQVGCLLSGASLFVGPDTVVTHAAAAAGIPTVALFGPSNPVKWGPWPRGIAGPHSPFRFKGSQHVGCVYLLQGVGDCVPCRMEGCDRHVNSTSRCLQEMTAQQVIDAARRVMAASGAPSNA